MTAYLFVEEEEEEEEGVRLLCALLLSPFPLFAKLKVSCAFSPCEAEQQAAGGMPMMFHARHMYIAVVASIIGSTASTDVLVV
jgi:hypothetical protein